MGKAERAHHVCGHPQESMGTACRPLPILPYLILWPRVFLERVQQNAFLDCQSQQFSCIMRACDKHNHFQVLSLFPKEL